MSRHMLGTVTKRLRWDSKRLLARVNGYKIHTNKIRTFQKLDTTDVDKKFIISVATNLNLATHRKQTDLFFDVKNVIQSIALNRFTRFALELDFS